MNEIHQIATHIATVFMGFFAIMNPVANTPIFIGLTQGDDAETKKAVAMKAMLLAFIIVSVFCISGKVIFDLFGITITAFRIVGGILVFMIGYHMLQGSESSAQSPSDSDKAKSREAELGVAVSPLAMPILAGPGTIATGMNYSTGDGFTEMLLTIGIFGVLCVITYFFFIYGQKLVDYVGQSAINVITRMMGLILAVIGMQMLIGGITGAVKSATG